MISKAPREVRYGGAMLDEREIAAVTNVMRTGLAVGAQVRGFEKRCAEVLGKQHGIMVNSGSSALLVALRLLDLPPGSEVITPVVTFSTDVSSIIHAGCVPAFVDVELDSYQIDLARIERMITPNTSAMLIPNLLGNIPDWDALRALADKHGLKLIEDSCDTLGSRLRGRPPGTRADLSCTSFSIFHIITCLGTGGLVATNDPKQWDRGLVMRSWGRSSDKFLHGTRQNDAEKRFGPAGGSLLHTYVEHDDDGDGAESGRKARRRPPAARPARLSAQSRAHRLSKNGWSRA